MHVCLCLFPFLSACRRKRVYLFCCSTLSLGFAIFACSMYVIFCTILVHRWFRLCLPLFPFRFTFFPSVIGVPSSFIAICFRCVVFLTSFYGVLSPTLWLKKRHVAKLQLELRFWLHSSLRMMGYHTLGPECFASLPNRYRQTNELRS